MCSEANLYEYRQNIMKEKNMKGALRLHNGTALNSIHKASATACVELYSFSFLIGWFFSDKRSLST